MLGQKKQDLRANTYQPVSSYDEVDINKISKTRSFEIINNVFENDDIDNLSDNNFVCLGLLKSTNLQNPYLWKYWTDKVTHEYHYDRVYYYACFLDVSQNHMCLSDGLIFVPVYKIENDYVTNSTDLKASSYYPLIQATKDCIGGFYSDYAGKFDGNFIDRAKLMLQVFEQYDIKFASNFEKKILKNAYDNTFLMLYDNTFVGKKHVDKNTESPIGKLLLRFRNNQRQNAPLSEYIEYCEKRAKVASSATKNQDSANDISSDGIVKTIKKNKEKKNQKKIEKKVEENFKL